MADFKNPQQEPGAEKRLLLVFLLTFVVLIVFQPLLKKYLPQAPATPQKQSAPEPTQAVAAPAATPSAAMAAVTPAKLPQSTASKQASSETETVVENDLYKITFTNRGAQVKSWILKKFDNDAQNGPLDLVNTAAAQRYGYPLSLWTYDETLRNKLSSALYVASQDGRLSAPADLTFEYSDQDVVVRKTFHFDHTYVLNVETSVVYKGADIFAPPAWPAGFGDQSTAASYAAARIDYHNDASTERSGYVFFPNYISRLAVKSISGGNTIKGPFEWAGPGDQYFAAIFVPDNPDSAAMVTLRNSLQVPRDPQKADSKETVNVDVIGAAVGDLRGPTAERMYVGPKELSSLEAVHVPTIKNGDPDLRGTVDFGWWGLISRPLFLWLKWTYKHIVPNWGWAIVIQTLIITVALLPLRITQMKSMLKMQRIAPQIKSIQEKYKKYSLRDPRKAAMNEEISGLYKKEGVNPAGGCLPLLIQFPFLIAYYRMLGVALDLRHAHWLWVSDLSARDPYFILPILMVASMFAMQRMTPQAGMDPAQQKMMTWMMPLMMGFLFFNFAAGLNLYYAETNLISMAQQAIMNRTKLGREMREMMEKRARKKEK
ncbi:MAG TPA: membrane protein insertase YidC [Candidatus Deferrimicrobiaceae bacterium]|nr:membrane protein insertase YidC [Candidatus Deferrimicrobiaceae bacterium]